MSNRVGILGTGNMATALGAGWRAAGHEVLTGGRTGPVPLADAGRFGQVVLLAVPASAVLEVLDHIPTGRTVIDCTNAVTPDFGVAHPYTDIITARPDLQAVKAFNLCHDSVWRQRSRLFGGRRLAVPMCGPTAAKETVAQLVTDLGCTPLDAGGPERAALLEATAAFAIGLWFAGADAQAMLQPLHTDTGESLLKTEPATEKIGTPGNGSRTQQIHKPPPAEAKREQTNQAPR